MNLGHLTEGTENLKCCFVLPLLLVCINLRMSFVFPLHFFLKLTFHVSLMNCLHLQEEEPDDEDEDEEGEDEDLPRDEL